MCRHAIDTPFRRLDQVAVHLGINEMRRLLQYIQRSCGEGASQVRQLMVFWQALLFEGLDDLAEEHTEKVFVVYGGRTQLERQASQLNVPLSTNVAMLRAKA